MKDYFDSFLLKQPQGKIIESHVNIGEGWASDVGIYEFTMGATGDKVKGRYSYNYGTSDRDDDFACTKCSLISMNFSQGGRNLEDPAPPQQCYARGDCHGQAYHGR